MSLFDSSQNITDVQLKLILTPINKEMLFVFGDDSLWFIEETSQRTETGLMSTVRKSNLDTVCLYYEDIRGIVEGFKEDYDKIQVNTNKSIPEQLGNVFRGYLSSQSHLDIKSDPLFVALDNNISEYFTNIYQGYLLRNMVGQRGFEVSPDHIGYLHVMFHSDDHNTRIEEMMDVTEMIDMTVHWFVPLVMVEQGK